MKEVAVIVYEDDGQFDVEVYELKNGGLSNAVKNYATYALADENEVISHIDKVKKEFQVVKVENVDLSIGEKPSMLSSKLGTPQFATYQFNHEDDFIDLLEQEILVNHGLAVKLSIYCEHNYIDIDLDASTPKETVQTLKNIYRIDDEDLTDEVIADVFGDYASYTYVEREDAIFIHIPFSAAVKKFQTQ